MSEPTEIKLTEYAHGAGCGCKIAPKVLEEILAGGSAIISDEKLLVGNQHNDDAAVYDLGNGTALIATTDFFMPIVDDAFDFGRVAAANAISDVYAMGGKPILALAILGWPVDKLPAALARRVMEGARSICAEAGITLAGGHSIDTTEPVFGLSVNGTVNISNLKRNHTAKEGDLIYLTKSLGTGILSTAGKRKLLKSEHQETLVKQLTTLNLFGTVLGTFPEVNALTDVTGFGLLGHLLEICEGSGLGAILNYSKLPLLPGLPDYIAQAVLPDATFRNWNAYSPQLELHPSVNSAEAFMILPDPQTNGGLLFTVSPQAQTLVETAMQAAGLAAHAHPIGVMTAPGSKLIQVQS
jgi:selenide,water dikinase